MTIFTSEKTCQKLLAIKKVTITRTTQSLKQKTSYSFDNFYVGEC